MKSLSLADQVFDLGVALNRVRALEENPLSRPRCIQCGAPLSERGVSPDGEIEEQCPQGHQHFVTRPR